MKSRPAHADDCPGCDTGWTASGILCMRCTDAVNFFNAGLFPAFMKHRAEYARIVANDSGGLVDIELASLEACREVYFRGVIIGTAIVLTAQRNERHAAWIEKKKKRRAKA